MVGYEIVFLIYIKAFKIRKLKWHSCGLGIHSRCEYQDRIRHQRKIVQFIEPSALNMKEE